MMKSWDLTDLCMAKGHLSLIGNKRCTCKKKDSSCLNLFSFCLEVLKIMQNRGTYSLDNVLQDNR